MANDLLNINHDQDDEDEIMLDIERTIEEQRRQLSQGKQVFRSRQRGVRAPILVNVGAILVVGIVLLVLNQIFLSDQESYVLQSATLGEQGMDIVAALLAEAQASLEVREQRIEEITREIDTIDTRVAELDEMIQELSEALRSAPREEREALLQRRSELVVELEREVEQRDVLLAQVAAQEQRMSAGATPPGDDPLQALREQEQLRALFGQQILTSYRSFSNAVGLRDWDNARNTLVGLRDFLVVNPLIEQIPGIRDERLVHAAMVDRLEGLLAIVEGNLPELEDTDAATPDDTVSDELRADILPGWNRIRQELLEAQRLAETGRSEEAVARFETVITSIPGVDAGMGLVMSQVEERTVGRIRVVMDDMESVGASDPETMLRVLSEELARPGDNIPEPIRRLGLRLADAVEIVEEQQAALEDLTTMATAQLALLQQSLGSDHGSAVETREATAESIAMRIESLRVQAARNLEERQQLSRELEDARVRNAELERHAETLRSEIGERNREIEPLREFRQAVESLQEEYRQMAPLFRAHLSDGSRASLNEAFSQLLTPFQSAVAESLFPDYGNNTRTIVETLIAAETDRAVAEAEERLILEMMQTSERIAEEQIRLLARGASAADSMDVLDSLIREIDSVVETARAERSATSFGRPIGTVIDSRPGGQVTVRRATDFPTFMVRRVFFSRQLPNGDRIPIAEGEIIAASGENVVLRVTSTIAPTIFPERNDIVNVEF